MAKRSIGSLMRNKLSDITNLQAQPKLSIHEVEDNPLEIFPSDNKDCIEQLLKERVVLIQLLAQRKKMIELRGAELRRLRFNIQKLQLQNLNLAQSNSKMLAELNFGRERMRALQHELLCKAALVKGKNLEVEGKVETNYENNESNIATVDSATASTKEGGKEKVENRREHPRRHSGTFKTHEREPLGNLFKIEDAKYAELNSCKRWKTPAKNSCLKLPR